MSTAAQVPDCGQPAWMATAWAELGQMEAAGQRTNPRIGALFREAGHAEIRDDETAWCAAFVGACLERAGIRSTRSLMARSYLAWGQPIATPRPGCITVLSRGSDPSTGHVAFWIGASATHALVLGGNQHDAVSVAPLSLARVIGYRWPLDAPKSEPASGLDLIKPGDVFEAALRHVLAVEGGYTNDPYDPGGPTNKGITLSEFARFKDIALNAETQASAIEALKRISDDDVQSLYRRSYWVPTRAGDLPAPLALMHFDAAVNHGVARAAQMLQQALGVDVDGEIGPQTLAAARDADVTAAVERYADLRRGRYRALPHFWRFGRGWLRRVDTTLTTALSPKFMTMQKRPHQQGEVHMSEQNKTEPASEPGKWWAHSLTIWGTLLTAATTVVPVLGPAFGITVSAEVIRQLGDQTGLAVQAIGGVVGTVMAIYGRSRADTRLARRELRMHL